jgi:homoserine O-acetyltransferase/O-succinyltransferase
MTALPPATGAWRPGDDPGRRRFVELFTDAPLELEAGGSVGPVTVAYETWGRLDPEGGNAVLVEHALSGDSHVTGPTGPGHGTAGWWSEVVGPGKAIDTERWFVVCPNVLGGCQGTTGPSSPAPDGRPYGSRWPRTTIRDQVTVDHALAEALGIARWAAVVGGSMGGMRALEYAVMFPERLRHAVVIACGARSTADQIALGTIQNRAIRLDPNFRGGDYYDAAPGQGPHEGLGLARRLGHYSYRTGFELGQRFGREPQGDEDPLDGGRYAVESYLDHHAAKLVTRFDANSYVALTEAMNHHDVGRGRGGLEAALARVRASVTVVGVDSDRLYPPDEQAALARMLGTRADQGVLRSPFGHDGFLIESGQLAALLETTLRRVASPAAFPSHG